MKNGYIIYILFGLLNVWVLIALIGKSLILASLELMIRSPLTTVSTKPKSTKSDYIEAIGYEHEIEWQTLLSKNKGRMVERNIHKVEFGSPCCGNKRSPVVMIRSQLPENVHKRFLEYPIFSCDESELNMYSEGFENRVKVPKYIYEGYFHSLTTKSAVFSRNPNPIIAIDFDKPAAPRFIRAFYEAFRRINSDIFEHLRQSLLEYAAQHYPNDPKKDVCYQLADWIGKGFLFGDLSIQLHYGQGNNELWWHTDAENSLLHFAVTLHGNRTLHSRRSEMTHGSPKEIHEDQHSGSVYLSSSTLMMHAPKFPDTNYETRTIAIHARILYTTPQLELFRSTVTEENWSRLINTIANTFSSADLKMPLLAQVEMIESEIS